MISIIFLINKILILVVSNRCCQRVNKFFDERINNKRLRRISINSNIINFPRNALKRVERKRSPPAPSWKRISRYSIRRSQLHDVQNFMEKNSSARNESRYNLALRFARMWSDIKTRDGSAAWARMDVRYRCDLLQSLESRASSSNRGSRISTTSSHPRRTYYYAKSSSTVLDYYLKIVWPTVVDAVVSAELCRPKWLSVAFPFEMPVGWLIAGRGTCWK